MGKTKNRPKKTSIFLLPPFFWGEKSWTNQNPPLPTPHGKTTLTFMVCSTVAILTLGGGFGGSILGIGNLPLGPAGLQKCFGQKGNISDYLGWLSRNPGPPWVDDYLMICGAFVTIPGGGEWDFWVSQIIHHKFQVEALYSSLYRWGFLHFRYPKCWWDYPPTASEKFWTYFQVVRFFNFKRNQLLCFRKKISKNCTDEFSRITILITANTSQTKFRKTATPMQFTNHLPNEGDSPDKVLIESVKRISWDPKRIWEKKLLFNLVKELFERVCINWIYPPSRIPGLQI